MEGCQVLRPFEKRHENGYGIPGVDGNASDGSAWHLPEYDTVCLGLCWVRWLTEKALTRHR